MEIFETLGSVLGWIVFGIIAGALARLLHPGRDQMGLLATMMLGIVGSLIGGGLWYLFKGGAEPYSPGGFLMAVVCAIVLLALGLFVSESSKTRR